MLQEIHLHLPNLSPVIRGDMRTIFFWLAVLFLAGLSALFLSIGAAERFHGNREKAQIGFLTITLLATAVLLCFFGLSAMTLKGMVFALILAYASYEDIRSRECDDSLHVMIVIAGLIGTGSAALVKNAFAAALILCVILSTLLFSKEEIGGADIKLSAACVFVLGLSRGLFGLGIGCLFAVVCNLIKNRKNKKAGFPMIPYLAAGFMAAYFI